MSRENARNAAVSAHLSATEARKRADAEDRRKAENKARRRASYALAELFDLISEIPIPAELKPAGDEGTVWDAQLDGIHLRVWTATANEPVIAWLPTGAPEGAGVRVNGLEQLGSLISERERSAGAEEA